MNLKKHNPANQGIVLVIVAGLLSLLALLAVVYIQLLIVDRHIGRAHVDKAEAHLLALSGMEYAFYRLKLDPTPATDPEDDLTYREGESVPLERAENPSYNADPYSDIDGNGKWNAGDTYTDPDGSGEYEGWSFRLRGTYLDYANTGALKQHMNGQRRQPHPPTRESQPQLRVASGRWAR